MQIEDKNLISNFYDAVFYNSPLGIIHYDKNAIITACNNQFAQILGAPKEKFIGFNILDNITDESTKDAVKNSLKHGFGKIEGNYTSVLSKKTSYGYSLFFGIKNDLGEIERGIGIVQDLSAIKKMQQEIDTNQALLYNLIHSIPDLVWVKDKNGNYLTCNKRFEDLIGKKEDEIIGKNDYDFFNSEIADFFRKHDKKALDNQIKSINEETLLFADGHHEICETLKSPVYDSNKNILGVLGIARNISDRRKLEEELEISKFTIDNANVPIYWINSDDGDIFYVNQAACDSLGYNYEELTSIGVIQIDPNFNFDVWKSHSKNLLESRELRFETIHKRKDNTTFPVEIIAKILKFHDKIFNVAFAIDISSQKKAQESLKQSEKLLRESQEIANIGSWELDLKTNTFICSDQVYKIFGYNKESSLDFHKVFLNSIHPEDKGSVSAAYIFSLKTKEPFDFVYRIICNEKVLFVHVQCKTVFLEDIAIRSIGTIRDITDQHHLSQKVEYFTNYDNLTNLPNRFLFSSKLKEIIENDKELQQSFIAVCFIDLDNFKYINDTYGHNVGDSILKEFSKRLEKCIGTKGWIARFGGDEFSSVLENIKKPSDVASIAENILLMMKEPFLISKEHHQISVSIGISLYPNDTLNEESLITFADTAMHRAKESGKNRYEFYTNELTQAMTKKMQLLTQLDEALIKEQFELYYQPQINLKSKKIIGFEALIRWHHPTLGFISPADFIPIAEESKFIIPLGKWIMKKACLQAKEWMKEGLFDGIMAVNVSGVQFDEDNFAQTVESILKEVNLNPKYLEIEITESSLMKNSKSSLEQLEKLHSLNIRLAIDDFGTGYSSLAYLRKMPVNTLKIDQSFIQDLPKHKDACAVVETILALSITMKKDALAEGVETKEQLQYLKKVHCKHAQGYFFAKPLCKSDAKEYLLKQK